MSEVDGFNLKKKGEKVLRRGLTKKEVNTSHLKLLIVRWEVL